MKSFPRDVLLRRIELLERQYGEQSGTVSDRRPRRQRFLAAAARIRTHAAEGDAEFVDSNLRRVMVVVGLLPGDAPGRPQAKPNARLRARFVPQPADTAQKPMSV